MKRLLRYVVPALLASLLPGAVANGGEDDAPASDKPAADKPAAAPSDLVARASMETSLYSDSEHVTVGTPTVAASVENPISEWQIGGRYLVDVVTAASVDIVSTASRKWREVRQAGTLDGNFKIGEVGVGANGSVSREPDYLALNIGGKIGLDFAEKNVTTIGSYTYGHDTVGRHSTPFSVFSHTVEKHAFGVGASIVMNPSTLLALIGDAIIEHGDQSKPYRYVPMFSKATAAKIPVGADIDLVNALRQPERVLEQLPLKRDRFAFTARLAHRFTASTIRLEERVYFDTWGLTASSTELRYIVDLGRRVSVWPRARLHVQSPVTFWQRAYVANYSSAKATWDVPALRTGDRELGPLHAVTGGLGLKFNVGPSDDPTSWIFGVRGDVIWTKYSDDIYVTDRTSGFGALTLEAVFE